MSTMARKALGRGLGALLPAREASAPPAEVASERVENIALDRIDPNPYQPRKVFHAERLGELAQSIRSDGVIQPILVQSNGDRYTLVVGERRWRAAKLAGLLVIPAVVREIPPDRLLEVTLVENVQREDLNAIETAQAFDRLAREGHLSHEEIAERTGKDRSTITNLLRLLKLPPDVQQLVAERKISPGHARAILGLPDQEHQRTVAEKTAAQGLSVRQVERMVKRMTEGREVTEAHGPESVDPNVAAAVRALEQALGTRVRVVDRGNSRGRLEIEYYSMDDLNRIYSVIVRE
jgi:ParB family chromosome partitioning protein